MNNELNQISVRNNNQKGLITLLSVITVVLIGACVYFYFDKPECKESTTCDINKVNDEECDNSKQTWTTYFDNLLKSSYSQNINSVGYYQLSSVRINNGMVEAYISNEPMYKDLKDKYGDSPVKLSLTDIVMAYPVIYGDMQGEFNYIFIKKDGTVYAIDNNKLFNGNHVIDTYKLNFNDIVYAYSSTVKPLDVRVIGIDKTGGVHDLGLQAIN